MNKKEFTGTQAPIELTPRILYAVRAAIDAMKHRLEDRSQENSKAATAALDELECALYEQAHLEWE